MNVPDTTDPDLERRVAAGLLDVLIRAGLLLALVVLCYAILSPFVSLLAWSLILAVTLYPGQQQLARRIGGRQGLAAIVVVLVGIVILVAPTTLLMATLGDSVHDLIERARDNKLQFPAPPSGLAEWPIVGDKLHDLWARAHTDLPAFIQGMHLDFAGLSAKLLAVVGSIGGMVMLFLFSIIISGVIMAFGEGGARSATAIFNRLAGSGRGAEFAKLSTATMRAVALGVLGVALIQALAVGLVLLVAGVPFAGLLAFIVLVLGIAQVPALLVTLPAIVYIWWSGSYGTAAAVTYTVLLFLAGMLDNVLKPLMLGRGVDAPMPVVLLGALGGMASSGILGMFVGATFLALGYQIFMGWVRNNPAAPTPAAD